MKKEKAMCIVIFCLTAVIAVSIRAVGQEKKRKAPADGTFKILSSNFKLDLANVVKGAPFSATATTQHIQTLGDGNQIVQRNEASYYRDSDGRMRIDQRLGTIGKWAVAGDRRHIIYIADVATRRYYTLHPENRTASESGSPYSPAAAPSVKLKAPVKVDVKISAKQMKLAESETIKGEQKASLKEEKVQRMKLGAKNLTVLESNATTESDKVSNKDPKSEETTDKKRKESLGKRTIEGIEVDGSRLVFTIAAGEIGNIREILIVEESWYSPELQMTVMMKRSDPRVGETTWQLTNINRNEPDHSLFQIPADYRVVTAQPALTWIKQAAPSAKPTPTKPQKRTKLSLPPSPAPIVRLKLAPKPEPINIKVVPRLKLQTPTKVSPPSAPAPSVKVTVTPKPEPTRIKVAPPAKPQAPTKLSPPSAPAPTE